MGVHIGKEIEKIYQDSGMKLSEFAKRINTSSRNIYSIFEREELKTGQLQKISEVLRFDFFAFYQLEEEQHKVEESPVIYQKNTDTITVSLELDGLKSTLDCHIKRIVAINQLINKNK